MNIAGVKFLETEKDSNTCGDMERWTDIHKDVINRLDINNTN